jgi:release factor glutamine methyltransferase
MLTILNAIELSAEFLKKKGVESSRINAELLLANVLNCKRMDLYLKFDQPLTEEETANYREVIKRRGQREPLQYIVGSVEFYGLEFFVNKDVLIPRAETEHLVEELLSKIKIDENLKILDIGTGSGNIAISLSKHLPNSIVHSIDKSEKAIKIAKKNAKTHIVNGNLSFEVVDFNLYNVEENDKYDIIVSKPPYIGLNDYGKLSKELTEYEPKEALTDEKDGYSFYELISYKAKNILNQNGKLFFEIGFGQSEKIYNVMKNNGFNKIKIIKDYSKIDRVISGVLV